MMKELIRKLTTNYTEEEYEAWLFGNGLDFKTELDKGESHLDYVELGTTKPYRSIFVNPKMYKDVDLTTLPALSGNESFKDIACIIDDIACRTGYDPELLSDVFMEGLHDGETMQDAFRDMAIVAFELDF